jgi:hypothetical protein
MKIEISPEVVGAIITTASLAFTAVIILYTRITKLETRVDNQDHNFAEHKEELRALAKSNQDLAAALRELKGFLEGGGLVKKVSRKISN